jgi:putative PIN family toxin of toxin-antitoxin system
MKVVLDTNVLISGIFFHGPPYQILKAWQEKKLTIVITQDILSEYQRVSNELSKEFPSIQINQLLDLITTHAEVVHTKGIKIQICKDPDDNKFVECALASKSRIIVSGDRHLLEISGYKGITVISPRNFVDEHLK